MNAAGNVDARAARTVLGRRTKAISLAGRARAAAIHIGFITVEHPVGTATCYAEPAGAHSVFTIVASGTVFSIGARVALTPTTIDVGFVAVEHPVAAGGSLALPVSAHAAFTVASRVTPSAIPAWRARATTIQVRLYVVDDAISAGEGEAGTEAEIALAISVFTARPVVCAR